MQTKDDPVLTPERAMRYVMTLLAGIGIGAAITAFAVYYAIVGA